MKKIILTLLTIIIFSVNSFPQNGWIKIYDQQYYAINNAQVFQNQTLTNSALYIQLGTNNATQSNDAGRVYRMNNSSLQFYNAFNGGFDRLWSFTPFPQPHFYVILQNPFCVTYSDTNFALANYVGGCGIDCGDHTFYSTNYGSNWTTITQLGNDFIGTQSRGYDIDPNNSSIVYSIYPRIGSNNWQLIYKSINKGATWSIIDSVQAASYTLPYGYTKVNPFKTNFLYFRGNSSLYVSSNSGTGFTPAANSASFTDLKFSRFDSAAFAWGSNSFYKSTNNGLSWNLLSSVAENINCMALSPSDNNIFYAGSNTALYKSTNRGLSWFIYNDSFNPSRSVIGISMNSGMADTVFAVTRDAVYKVWGSYVSVKGISEEVPFAYSLSQNYPNPFNPSTNIKFSVPQKSFVSIVIYNVLGEKITKLVNSELQPGNYEAYWDAKNYPSGVYYYQLTVSSEKLTKYTETKKMVLIK